MLHGTTWYYMLLPDTTWYYLILHGTTGYYMILCDFILHDTILHYTTLYRTTRGQRSILPSPRGNPSLRLSGCNPPCSVVWFFSVCYSCKENPLDLVITQDGSASKITQQTAHWTAKSSASRLLAQLSQLWWCFQHHWNSQATDVPFFWSSVPSHHNSLPLF